MDHCLCNGFFEICTIFIYIYTHICIDSGKCLHWIRSQFPLRTAVEAWKNAGCFQWYAPPRVKKRLHMPINQPNKIDMANTKLVGVYIGDKNHQRFNYVSGDLIWKLLDWDVGETKSMDSSIQFECWQKIGISTTLLIEFVAGSLRLTMSTVSWKTRSDSGYVYLEKFKEKQGWNRLRDGPPPVIR